MQLTQQETNKVKERDEQHTVELREWRVEIAQLKQVHHPQTTPTSLVGVVYRNLRRNSRPAGRNKNSSIRWIDPFLNNFECLQEIEMIEI